MEKKRKTKFFIILIIFIFLFFPSYNLPEEIYKNINNDLLKDLSIYDVGIFYNLYEQHELVGTIFAWCKNNFKVEYKTHPQENIILFVFSGNDKNYISRKNVFGDDNILKDCYEIISFSFNYFVSLINSVTYDDLNSKKVAVKIEKDDGIFLNYNNRRVRGLIKFILTFNEWEIIFEDAGKDFVFDYIRANSKRKSNNSSFYTYYEFKGGGYNTFTYYTTRVIESALLKSKALQDLYE